MVIKAFEKIGSGDQKEHSEFISNLSDDDFREYLETLQSLAEEKSKKRKTMKKGKSSQEDTLEVGDKEEENLEESSLEELFDKIEDIANQLEQGDMSLEESFALYDKGLGLLKQSNSIIDEIEKKVLVLDSKGETHEL